MDVPARSLIPSTASRKSEGVGPLGPAVCQTASVRELPGKELVTDAKLNYHGSITIDADFCRAVASGRSNMSRSGTRCPARKSAPRPHGDEDSRCCILNGAAACTCQQGDEIIIASSVFAGSTISHVSIPAFSSSVRKMTSSTESPYEVFRRHGGEHRTIDNDLRTSQIADRESVCGGK
ncbi:aspartate 1-decarboxylase [Sinorhizobium psoraleae]|uniref:aspartate 1-decarboxylase n=1 Tax=Sinorhizobium psoraleae TaxID=520838 RepID=UPI0035E3D915